MAAASTVRKLIRSRGPKQLKVDALRTSRTTGAKKVIAKVAHGKCAKPRVSTDSTPTPTEADVEVVCAGVAKLLEDVASRGRRADALPGTEGPTARFEKLSVFHYDRVVEVDMSKYVKRFESFFLCSAECFVMAFVFIHRAATQNPQVPLNRESVHRFFAAAMTLAAKFQDDTFYTNDRYGRVAGLQTPDINRLERALLDLLNWRLFVSPTEYEVYHELLREAATCGELPQSVMGVPLCGVSGRSRSASSFPDSSDEL